ncbi:hypothetical protein FACS1894186_5230 [Alphaproteobacteria bacterium]|nr:hypothetical protein FACS1894186_5230 [Alphaproteobacteria bacterium]
MVLLYPPKTAGCQWPSASHSRARPEASEADAAEASPKTNGSTARSPRHRPHTEADPRGSRKPSAGLRQNILSAQRAAESKPQSRPRAEPDAPASREFPNADSAGLRRAGAEAAPHDNRPRKTNRSRAARAETKPKPANRPRGTDKASAAGAAEASPKTGGSAARAAKSKPSNLPRAEPDPRGGREYPNAGLRRASTEHDARHNNRPREPNRSRAARAAKSKPANRPRGTDKASAAGAAEASSKTGGSAARAGPRGGREPSTADSAGLRQSVLSAARAAKPKPANRTRAEPDPRGGLGFPNAGLRRAGAEAAPRDNRSRETNRSRARRAAAASSLTPILPDSAA